MNQSYKATLSQYALPQFLPIYSWGCLNFTLRYSCFTLRSKWGDLEGCSTGMVTDNSSIISQGFLYAPFGEIISEYTPGWETDRIPKYAFNAKELDEENGMYYYSARYYAPPTFISRDPMFEKYPSISPYTYCANNPMKFVDPTGEKVVVTGDEADAAVTQMQSRTENLTFTRNPETNEIEITGGKAKTKEEKYMKKIIDDQDITVNITATNNEKTSTGVDYSIDAFMGVTCSENANGEKSASSTNEYNVNKGATVDKGVKSPGNFVWHAIAEGFEAGKTGQSEGYAINDNKPHPIYDIAHSNASIYFPGDYNTTQYINHLINPKNLLQPPKPYIFYKYEFVR